MPCRHSWARSRTAGLRRTRTRCSGCWPSSSTRCSATSSAWYEFQNLLPLDAPPPCSSHTPPLNATWRFVIAPLRRRQARPTCAIFEMLSTAVAKHSVSPKWREAFEAKVPLQEALCAVASVARGGALEGLPDSERAALQAALQTLGGAVSNSGGGGGKVRARALTLSPPSRGRRWLCHHAEVRNVQNPERAEPQAPSVAGGHHEAGC